MGKSLNSSSVSAESPGTCWYPGEKEMSDSRWTRFLLSGRKGISELWL